LALTPFIFISARYTVGMNIGALLCMAFGGGLFFQGLMLLLKNHFKPRIARPKGYLRMSIGFIGMGLSLLVLSIVLMKRQSVE
jgi:hypothetical protein